jgi:hypothetical protein
MLNKTVKMELCVTFKQNPDEYPVLFGVLKEEDFDEEDMYEWQHEYEHDKFIADIKKDLALVGYDLNFVDDWDYD